jgi:hypothetical protein
MVRMFGLELTRESSTRRTYLRCTTTLTAVHDDIVLEVVARIADSHGAVNQADIEMLRSKSIAGLDVRFTDVARRERGQGLPLGCANRAL